MHEPAAGIEAAPSSVTEPEPAFAVNAPPHVVDSFGDVDYDTDDYRETEQL